MKAIPNKKRFGPRTLIIPDSPAKLRKWRRTVRATCMAAGVKPIPGPIELELEFWIPRPKSVKRESPIVRGSDLDKLARAILDAIDGVAYDDDAQVVALRATKRYAGSERLAGCRIAIAPEPLPMPF